MNLFDALESQEPENASNLVPPTIKILVRVRRLEDGTSFCNFEVGTPSVRQTTFDYAVWDWIGEDLEHIVLRLRQAQNLKIGQQAILQLVLKPWSYTSHSYDGDEYNSGFDVLKVRTFRKSKPRSAKYRY